MALTDYKASEIFSGFDISSLSDRPNEDGLTSTQLKARFDYLIKNMIPLHNSLINALIVLLENGNETNGHKHNVDNLIDGTTNRLFTETLKLKLDGIASGAEVNQNAFSSIKVGGSTGNANSKTATFEIVSGSNIIASIDPLTNKVTLSATGDISTLAVQSILNDIGNYYNSLEVNGALQEIGENITNIKSQLADIVTNVKTFGAKGDGVTDDAPALRNAVNYLASKGGGKLLIPEGNYLLASYDPSIELNNYWICKLSDYITIEGKGELSCFKVADNINSTITDGSSGVSVFLSNNRSYVTLRNFKVDCNGTNNTVPQGVTRTFYGVKFSTGSNCTVENTHWENNPGRNVILFFGFGLQQFTRSGAIVRNNVIHNFGSGVAGNVYQNDSSAIYCDWDQAVIEGNLITNDNPATSGRGGIEIHNSNSVARNNFLRYCYPGIYLTCDYFYWTANKVYNVGDVIIPTRGKFVGRRYQCTTAGTSGATEPTWSSTTTDNTVTWTDYGVAQSVNQVLDGNTLEKCHGGIFLWNGGGDFNNTRIVKNSIGLLKSPSLSNTIAGITQVQGNDASGLTIPVNNNLVIEDNEIYEDATLSASSTATTSGIHIYSGDNIQINRNNIHDLDSAAITILGSPRYLKNVGILHNTIKNFQVNNVVSAKGAIAFNLTGSTTIPSVSNFDATNVYLRHNYITNDVYDGTAYAFRFDWGASSVITNLLVSDNTLNNLAGAKAGANMNNVNITPDTFFQSATGWFTDKSGFTAQWTRVTYTATAGTNQTFSFPKAFASANIHVQLTPSNNNSGAIPQMVSKTSTQFTLTCNVTNQDIHVYAVGH